MSHYTVAVFTDEYTSLENLMDPYWEELEVEPYVDITREQALKRIEDVCSDNEELRKDFIGLSDKEKISRFFGYSKFNENGDLLSTYNPDSKWDWYEIGGRWSGMLKTKSGDFVNSCLVKDLDLTPDEDEYAKAIRFWEIVVEDSPLKEGETKPFNLYGKEYFVQRYGNKENYAKIRSSISTYAVLTPDGEWHEPGQMGWWGISNATTDDEKLWDELYAKFLEEANPEWTITIVDCHI